MFLSPIITQDLIKPHELLLLGCDTGEAVNASSGLGFNGYDEKGKAKWDLIDNADIFKIEVCIEDLVCSILNFD